MLTSTVLEHFGRNLSAVARAAGVTRQAVQQWGKVVPEHTAWRLSKLHELAFREDDYTEIETIRRQRISRTMRRKVGGPSGRARKDKKPPEPTSAAGA